MSGRLIVFEGGEGAGKTTQIERSQAWLIQKIGNKCAVIATREPGGTDLGKQLRTLLLHGDSIVERAELLLFAADRAQHIDTVIRPALAAGSWVLCDRFTDSTWAYQGAGRGLDRELIAQLNAIATGGLTSDLTLWLDVPVEVGLSRRQGKGDRIEAADLAFHERVRGGFAELAVAEPERIVRIEANGSLDQVEQQIQEAIAAKGFW
ncbi:dTMP kinase [Spirulina sp. CCNP1310]|uniref:dTMP kinase n=1 Tax=Spirulina sp. CCNP1310 TaxID=3110249 RepID=UPI002B21C9F1|nr:dTMP kinase [Spirulina sp. CCNP1310]MEA5419506.1 dTMP kinase [Spirulina sp. CCNP1310]